MTLRNLVAAGRLGRKTSGGSTATPRMARESWTDGEVTDASRPHATSIEIDEGVAWVMLDRPKRPTPATNRCGMN